jgi:O-antigen ligase/polysaccharide polymerase Wzy-like membrane protein
VSDTRAVRPIRAVSQPAVALADTARPTRLAAGFAPAAGAIGMAPLVLLGFNDGGYHSHTWRWATLGFLAAAGVTLCLRRGVTLGRPACVSLAALGALALWTLLSALWGSPSTEAAREAERCALYAAALTALLLVVRPWPTTSLLAGVLAGVVALALYGLGQRVLDPQPPDPYQGSLLYEPVGYANAVGLLMALGVVLALGLLVDEKERAQRALLAAAAGIAGVALSLTGSRGAWLAALVGAGVLVVLRNGWVRRHRLAVASLALVGIAVVAFATTKVSLGDRPAYWRVAVDDAAEHPYFGSGAGSFDDYWLDHRPIPAYVQDAHSLYLETAAELGLVGLVLLLCALGAPLAAATRTRDPRLVAPAAAAYSVFLIHAGLDWDWEMPVTTVAGLACGAALLSSSPRLSRT